MEGGINFDLMTFDVQGAYNGVKADLLAKRLRQRNILEKIVQWVESFRTDRKACLAFGKYCSEVLSLVELASPKDRPYHLFPIYFIIPT